MFIKRIFWNLIERIISHSNFRAIFSHSFPEKQNPSTNELLNKNAQSHPSCIYHDIHIKIKREQINPIFITARFRSGSTLLWSIFREINGIHSYYEPLNERMWFDKKTRSDFVDRSHLGVSDYWKEYQNVRFDSNLFSRDWTYKRLIMDSTSFAPELNAFIQSLITQAPTRPALQFNRVDFRLQWLRANYPDATIVHLFRHPRDQWVSVLRYSAPVSLDFTGHDYSKYNLFYTIPWARDLCSTFPFLDPIFMKHPYYYHYLIWRLSYIYGSTFSNISISFEDLVSQTKPTLAKLFKTTNIDDVNIDKVSARIKTQSFGKWRHYADDEWYQTIESECDDILQNYFLNNF